MVAPIALIGDQAIGSYHEPHWTRLLHSTRLHKLANTAWRAGKNLRVVPVTLFQPNSGRELGSIKPG